MHNDMFVDSERPTWIQRGGEPIDEEQITIKVMSPQGIQEIKIHNSKIYPGKMGNSFSFRIKDNEVIPITHLWRPSDEFKTSMKVLGESVTRLVRSWSIEVPIDEDYLTAMIHHETQRGAHTGYKAKRQALTRLTVDQVTSISDKRRMTLRRKRKKK